MKGLLFVHFYPPTSRIFFRAEVLRKKRMVPCGWCWFAVRDYLSIQNQLGLPVPKKQGRLRWLPSLLYAVAS